MSHPSFSFFFFALFSAPLHISSLCTRGSRHLAGLDTLQIADRRSKGRKQASKWASSREQAFFFFFFFFTPKKRKKGKKKLGQPRPLPHHARVPPLVPPRLDRRGPLRPRYPPLARHRHQRRRLVPARPGRGRRGGLRAAGPARVGLRGRAAAAVLCAAEASAPRRAHPVDGARVRPEQLVCAQVQGEEKEETGRERERERERESRGE